MKDPQDDKVGREKLLARLKKHLLSRKAPYERRKKGARATRQQFLEATRNVGVIVVATCFTAGWIVTNPNLNTDNVGWGIAMGLLLIFIGSFGYGYIERDNTSNE